MLSFSENIKISINLLNYLVDKPKNTTDLAKLCGTTKRMLDSVIKTLKVHSLIKCSRGRKGGIYKDKEINNISLYDLCKAFYPEIEPNIPYSKIVYYNYIKFLKSIPIMTNGIVIVSDSISANVYKDSTPATPATTYKPVSTNNTIVLDNNTPDSVKKLNDPETFKEKMKELDPLIEDLKKTYDEDLDGEAGW